MADKCDMPVLAKHVAVYLNTVKIGHENVAQCFAWADKFGADSTMNPQDWKPSGRLSRLHRPYIGATDRMIC